MKRLILAVSLILAVPAVASYGAFCAGYEKGFAAGHCQGQGYGCVPPVSPVCPVPGPDEDSFMDGYNRGFTDGLSTQ
jgi:hypothetical protein